MSTAEHEVRPAPVVDAPKELSEVYRRVDGLFRLAVLNTGFELDSSVDNSKPGAYSFEDQLIAQGICNDLQENPAADNLVQISTMSQEIVDSLHVPDNLHGSLDALLKLESVQKASQEFSHDICEPGEVFDGKAIEIFETISKQNDKAALIKLARLICSRSAATEEGLNNLEGLFGEIFSLIQDSRDTATKQLYKDMVTALTVAGLRIETDTNVPGAYRLFAAFAKALGYKANYVLTDVWDENGSSRKNTDRESYIKKNIRNMIELEQNDPGSCAQITEIFGIRNFARYKPKTLTRMLRERTYNPDAPYVLEIDAASDHNFAMFNPENKARIQRQLGRHGVRYEVQECATIQCIDRAVATSAELKRQGAEISDIIVQSHGSPDKLSFGVRNIGITATNATLFAGFTASLGEKAKIYLNSCSSGKSHRFIKSVAEHIADSADRKVVAPTVKTAGSRTKVRRTEDHIGIDLRFRSARLRDKLLVAPLVLTPLTLILPELALEIFTNFRYRREYSSK